MTNSFGSFFELPRRYIYYTTAVVVTVAVLIFAMFMMPTRSQGIVVVANGRDEPVTDNPVQDSCNFVGIKYEYIVIEDVVETLKVGSVIGNQYFETIGVKSVEISENPYISLAFNETLDSKLQFRLKSSLSNFLLNNATTSALQLTYNLVCQGQTESRQGQLVIDILDENNIAPAFELEQYSFSVDRVSYENSGGGIGISGIRVVDYDYLLENAVVSINISCTFEEDCEKWFQAVANLEEITEDEIHACLEPDSCCSGDLDIVMKNAGFHYNVDFRILPGIPQHISNISIWLNASDGLNSNKAKVEINFTQPYNLSRVSASPGSGFPISQVAIATISVCVVVAVAIVGGIFIYQRFWRPPPPNPNTDGVRPTRDFEGYIPGTPSLLPHHRTLPPLRSQAQRICALPDSNNNGRFSFDSTLRGTSTYVTVEL